MKVFSFTFPPVHTKPLKTHSGTLVIFLILMLTIPKCLHTDINYVVSVKHNNPLLLRYSFRATCFDPY